MTLKDAVRTLGTTAKLVGVSDQALTTDVATRQRELVRATPGLPSKSTVTTALGLHGDLHMRPIAAMLELARGTALNDDPEIAAVARRWPVLRHLGIFARDPQTGMLRLDDAALQYVGPNQRRVLSEELGIGFGILSAKMWCRARNNVIGPITAIDVDKALFNGAVPNLQRNGERQPDYLLSYPNPARSGEMVFELLETKGTVSHSNAKAQLGRAVTQLAGLTIDGRAMTGLATSTVSNDGGLTVMAVDPKEPTITWAPTDEKLAFWRGAEERTRRDVFHLDVGADELFATATNVDRASLAEFSGQHEAAIRWLPRFGDRRIDRNNANVQRETQIGEFVGTEFVIDVRGTGLRLRLFQGVEKHIAEALRSLDPIAVVEAQRSFARMELDEYSGADTSHGEAEQNAALAFSSDGSLLELSVD